MWLIHIGADLQPNIGSFHKCRPTSTQAASVQNLPVLDYYHKSWFEASLAIPFSQLALSKERCKHQLSCYLCAGCNIGHWTQRSSGKACQLALHLEDASSICSRWPNPLPARLLGCPISLSRTRMQPGPPQGWVQALTAAAAPAACAGLRSPRPHQAGAALRTTATGGRLQPHSAGR